MKKTLTLPILLLSTTPFILSCTKSVTDTEVSSPMVTWTTETITPQDTLIVSPPWVTLQSWSISNPPIVSPVVLTRSEVVNYSTPASPQDPVEFSVTITDGVITAASALSKSDSPISQKYQTAFAGDISAKAIGRKAKDLKLDAVGGASLTTAAFEQFVHSF